MVRVNGMLYDAYYRGLLEYSTYLCPLLVDEIGLLALEVFGEVTYSLLLQVEDICYFLTSSRVSCQ